MQSSPITVMIVYLCNLAFASHCTSFYISFLNEWYDIDGVMNNMALRLLMTDI